MSTIMVTEWQGQAVWVAIGSNGPDWRVPRHATTDALDGRAVCGAWVYQVEGRAGATIRNPRGWQEYHDGTPMEHRVTCKRCLSKLATARV